MSIGKPGTIPFRGDGIQGNALIRHDLSELVSSIIDPASIDLSSESVDDDQSVESMTRAHN